MSSPENRAKGVVFHTFFDVLRSRHGEPAVKSVLASAPEELAHALRYGAIVKGGWYPLGWYCDLHRVAFAVTSDARLAYTVGYDSTIADLQSGILRMVLKAVNPGFALTIASAVFNRYYELGKLHVDSRDHGCAARFEGCVGFDRNVWQDVLGGCEGGATAAGARDVRLVQLSGGREGDTSCSIELHWR
jgi:hypothetical protein